MAYAALLGTTIEYFEILCRREDRRRHVAERAASEEAGLGGLLRVFLTMD